MDGGRRTAEDVQLVSRSTLHPPPCHPVEHGQGIGESGRIGGGGTGGDDVERVADHVGDDQAVEGPAGEGLGQSASLERAEVLADGVHLVDGRAAGVQQFRDGLLVGQGHAGSGSGQEGRAAAGNQTQGHVVGPRLPGESQDLLGPGHALQGRMIAAGRAGGVQADALQGPYRFGRDIDDAFNLVQQIGEALLRRRRSWRPPPCRRPGREFAGPGAIRAAWLHRAEPWQSARPAAPRHGRVPDVLGLIAQGIGHVMGPHWRIVGQASSLPWHAGSLPHLRSLTGLGSPLSPAIES